MSLLANKRERQFKKRNARKRTRKHASARSKRRKSSFKNKRAKGFAKLLALLFDYGYIYLIESTHKASKSGRKKYKIGISYDLRNREQNIDESIKGSKEKVIFSVRMFYCEHYEGKLHNVFEQQQKDFRGSGYTEWFELTWFQKNRARGRMLLYKSSQQLRIFLFCILLFTVFYFVKTANNGKTFDVDAGGSGRKVEQVEHVQEARGQVQDWQR